MRNDSDQDDPRGPEAVTSGDDRVLRAKYLDYCSARLAEIFLSLSDERIFDLVEEAASEGRLNVAELSFEQMVKLVTEKLRTSVPLPDYETWVADYRADPEQYEPYLIGLWKRRLEQGETAPATGEEEG